MSTETTFKTPGHFQKVEKDPKPSAHSASREVKNMPFPKDNKAIFPVPADIKETESNEYDFPIRFKGPGAFQQSDMPENKKAGKTEVKEEPVEPTPSLTDVPEEVKSKKGRTIFVCVDQSKYTASLLDWCVDTMFQPTDKIVLMNVQSFVPFPVGLYPSVALDYARENRKIQEHAYNTGAKYLRKCVNHCRSIGYQHKLEMKMLLVSANAMSIKHAILENIEKHKPQLVVLCSRGMGALGRAFVGSVCDYLVHNSPSPVVVVKPKKDVIHKKIGERATSWDKIRKEDVHEAKKDVKIAGK